MNISTLLIGPMLVMENGDHDAFALTLMEIVTGTYPSRQRSLVLCQHIAKPSEHGDLQGKHTVWSCESKPWYRDHWHAKSVLTPNKANMIAAILRLCQMRPLLIFP